jgi:uncharacterized membrane protein affecting hemolysin expression
MDKLKFALEKILALVTSQRFLTTVVGIVLIIIAVQGIAASVFGFEPWQAPDDAELTSQIEVLIAQVATVITSVLAIVGVVAPLIRGYVERPPTLNRADYER